MVQAEKDRKRKERMGELKVELHKRLLENLNLAALEHATEADLKAEIARLSERVEELEARLAQAEGLLEECYEFVATPHHWREPWCKIAAFLHPEQVEKEKG